MKPPKKPKVKAKRVRRSEHFIVGFRCLNCHDIKIFGRPREFRTCKCGQASGDSGDGHYYRLMGLADGLMSAEVKKTPNNKKPL